MINRLALICFPACLLPKPLPASMTKLFVADDHELYLEGICLLLKRQEGIEICGTSSSASDLLEKLPTMQADIILLDVQLPDMDEETLLQSIRRIRPDQKILYLTMMRGSRYLHKLMKYGIQGYVLKSIGTNELLEAIQAVAAGGTYFSREPGFNRELNDYKSTINIGEERIDQILSKREIEVLKLICREYSNADIAARLFLSVSTVETHRKNLIAKLGVNNTVGLVKFALRHGLID